MQLTGATFSPDKAHRYSLERVWNPHKPHVAVIGFNPSTADALKDDPTMTRTIDFARGFGFGSLTMLNLFTRRTVDPKGLGSDIGAALGPMAISVMRRELERADSVVCAWGALAHKCPEHVNDIRAEILNAGHVHTYSVGAPTKDGHPRHPLYLPAVSELRVWPPVPA